MKTLREKMKERFPELFNGHSPVDANELLEWLSHEVRLEPVSGDALRDDLHDLKNRVQALELQLAMRKKLAGDSI